MEGEGLNLESVAVTDTADFEKAEVQPAGGGDGGGAAGEEESGAEGKRRHGEADKECDSEGDCEKAAIHSKPYLKTGLFVYDYVYIYENGNRWILV